MISVRLEHGFSGASGGFAMNVNLESDGRSLAFFGPSGSGKTLTLQAIAGLFRPKSGKISVNGRVLFDSGSGVNVPARGRGLGYLFQDYAIFPHLTVRDNIAFGLRTGKSGKRSGEVRQRVDEMLRGFELEAVAGQYPARISGGQKQRVALARALANRPDLLLLDEPFSALDPLLRARVRGQCRELLDRFAIPTVIITHDPADVLAMADTVTFYENGRNSPCHALDTLAPDGGEHDHLLLPLLHAKKTQKLLEQAESRDDAEAGAPNLS